MLLLGSCTMSRQRPTHSDFKKAGQQAECPPLRDVDVDHWLNERFARKPTLVQAPRGQLGSRGSGGRVREAQGILSITA